MGEGMGDGLGGGEEMVLLDNLHPLQGGIVK